MRVAYNAASSFGNQFQALESANATALAGQTVTATVLVRANASWAATTSQGLNFYVEKNSTANTLTGGTWTSISSTVVTGGAISTGTSSSSWTKLTITCVVPNDGTAAGLRLRIGESVVGPSGAYWEMAQCQLEVGSAATPFSRAGGTIGGELALCQRYYQVVGGVASGYPLIGGYSVSGTPIYTPILFAVPMRATPTITKNGTWETANVGQPSSLYVSYQGFTLLVTSVATASFYVAPNSTDDTFTISAEL